jgi:probable selenium-dependent hydroxylase accessory protein YqeC
VIAFVGAGGKTTAILCLARELEGRGRSVLVTTTTHLFDPRREPDGPAGRLVFRPEMEFPHAGVAGVAGVAEDFRVDGGPEPGPGITLLVSREADEPGKVRGVHPSWVAALRPSWDFVLVEADGSRRLPLKAPGDHEPVLPPGTDLVVGVLGLDGLGRPMDARTVHRPERFAHVTGCEPGASIGWEHLVALVRHPEGLFKGFEGLSGAPAARVLLLNKFDVALSPPSRDQLAAFDVERILLCRLEGDEPSVTVFCREGEAPCR